MIRTSTMLPPRPAPIAITTKRISSRRMLFTVASALFVAGGLVSLALDHEPVRFAMPEPPPRPEVEQQREADEPVDPRDRELDKAFAHILAEVSTRR